MLYTLIINHVASYKELRDDYNIYEVLDLYEAWLVNVYNRSKIMEGAKNGRN